jgi:hypothetical protein
MPKGLSSDIFSHLPDRDYGVLVVVGAQGAGGNAVDGWAKHGQTIPEWASINDPWPALVSDQPIPIPGSKQRRWVHFVNYQAHMVHAMDDQTVRALMDASVHFTKKNGLKTMLMMGVNPPGLGHDTAQNKVLDCERVNMMWAHAEQLERSTGVSITLTLLPPNDLFVQRGNNGPLSQ